MNGLPDQPRRRAARLTSLWRQFPVVEAVLLVLSVGICFAVTAGLAPG